MSGGQEAGEELHAEMLPPPTQRVTIIPQIYDEHKFSAAFPTTPLRSKHIINVGMDMETEPSKLK